MSCNGQISKSVFHAIQSNGVSAVIRQPFSIMFNKMQMDNFNLLQYSVALDKLSAETKKYSFNEIHKFLGKYHLQFFQSLNSVLSDFEQITWEIEHYPLDNKGRDSLIQAHEEKRKEILSVCEKVDDVFSDYMMKKIQQDSKNSIISYNGRLYVEDNILTDYWDFKRYSYKIKTGHY